MTNRKCPVCGITEFKGYCSYEICPVCGWQDDRYDGENPNRAGGANHISLNEQRRNYMNRVTSAATA